MENSKEFKLDRVEMANILTPSFIEEKRRNGKPYVDYGVNNLFPQELLLLSNKGTTHPSCLKLLSIAIAGEGFTGLSEGATAFLNNLDYETSNSSLLEKIANSMSLFEGFVLEVIWNRRGDQIANVHLLPLEMIRAGHGDRYGSVNEYYYNPGWELYPNDYEVIPAFNPQRVIMEGAVVQPKQILYLGLPANLSKFYPIPSYVSAINFIASEYELGQHTLSSITNGFIPSSLITFVGNPSPEERSLNKRLFERNFTGAENSGKIIINYVEDIADKLMIDSLASNHNVDEYMNAALECKGSIVTSHGVISPALVGIPDQGSSIFANGEELKTTWDIFYNMKIRSYQKLVEKTMNLVLKYAGYPNEDYQIVPYTLLSLTDNTTPPVAN